MRSDDWFFQELLALAKEGRVDEAAWVYEDLQTPLYGAPTVREPVLVPELVALAKELGVGLFPVDAWDFIPGKKPFEPWSPFWGEIWALAEAAVKARPLVEGVEIEALRSENDALSVLLIEPEHLRELLKELPKECPECEVGAYFDTLDVEADVGGKSLTLHVPVRLVVPQQRVSAGHWTEAGITYPPLEASGVDEAFKLAALFLKERIKERGFDVKALKLRLGHSIHRHPGPFGFSTRDAYELVWRLEEGELLQLDGVFYAGKNVELPYFQAARIRAKKEGQRRLFEATFRPLLVLTPRSEHVFNVGDYPHYDRLEAKEHALEPVEAPKELVELAKELARELFEAAGGTLPKPALTRVFKDPSRPLVERGF